MKVIAEGLIRLADHLDKKGFSQEAALADEILQLLSKTAQQAPPAEDLEVEENVLEKDGDQPDEEENCDMQEEALMPMKAMEEKASLRRRARREKLLAKIG